MEMKENIITTAIDGEMVVLNLENGGYYAINQLGSDIISVLNNSNTEEIITYITEKYKVNDIKQIEKDVVEFIENLKKYEIIE